MSSHIEKTSFDFLALALSPPGNIAREISLYRRKRFAVSGLDVDLAFPEIAVLAFVQRDSPEPSAAMRRFCSELWPGIEGDFVSGRPLRAGSELFLGLGPAFERLHARCAATLPEAGYAMAAAPPFEPGKGVFLGRTSAEAPLPDCSLGFSFFDAELGFFGFHTAARAFSAQLWTRLCAGACRPARRGRAPCNE